MSNFQAVLLGGIAGLSIFLGLPIARLRGLRRGVQGFLNALATGILVFLLWDILTHANEPLSAALAGSHRSGPGRFATLAVLFAAGLGAGLIGLVYVNNRLMARARAAGQGPNPHWLAMAIATGLGLHNLSEGLAIGQAAATGAVAFAGVLVIGFALHNITEGFGIAAPMAGADSRPSWGFLAAAGLVGGGPTFVGTVIGIFATNSYFYVLFLALAAGALLFVLNELFNLGKKLNTPGNFAWGLLTGFLVALATDFLLTYLGA